MPGQLREGQHEPIEPLREGQPPGWIVSCLDCSFSHDEHGLTASDAIMACAARHENGHKMIARAMDYTTGYGEHRDEPHPLYQGGQS